MSDAFLILAAAMFTVAGFLVALPLGFIAVGMFAVVGALAVR